MAIVGVQRVPLHPNRDERGCFTELFRAHWPFVPDVKQWNVVSSNAGVLRGLHVHVVHHDYLAVISGHLRLVVKDLRPDSPTSGAVEYIDLRSFDDGAYVLPPGVAHAFTFLEPSVHIYGVSHYWDTSDELGCHWASPGVDVDWPFAEPLLSERDTTAGTYADLVAQVPAGLLTGIDR